MLRDYSMARCGQIGGKKVRKYSSKLVMSICDVRVLFKSYEQWPCWKEGLLALSSRKMEIVVFPQNKL